MTGTQPLTDDDPRSIGGYALSARLGQGGQGVVYLGRDDTDGAPVAVKTLHADGIDAAGLRRQLSEEVETARRVARFCTAQVLAADIDAEPPYVVSEYIEGPTLREVVRRDGPMSGAALERLAVGTLTALAAIHQAGIVHRDFKPGNVLMGHDGPRVIDFGIARALEGTAILTSQIAGTPAYMAPEQIAGRPLGPAVDLFSWGSTIAFAANGWGPFGQDSLHEVLHNVSAEPPDLGALDGRLRDIASRCLSKDPDQRPSAAETLMGVLGVAMPEPGGGAPAQAEETDEPGALPIHTLAAGAAAAAPEGTAAGLRESLAQEAAGDDGLFRSFPPLTPPPAGSGPRYDTGAGPGTAASSGPQTPPAAASSGPPPGAVQPGADPASAGGSAWVPPGAHPQSGPQQPSPYGGPAGAGPTGGQQPYGPSGPQSPYGPGPGAPPSGPQPPYGPGPDAAQAGPGPYGSGGPGPQQPSPYGGPAGAGPTGGQQPYGPSGPQSPYGPGPGAPPSGPQPPYGPEQGKVQPGPGAPYGPAPGVPGPQQPAPYGATPAAPQGGPPAGAWGRQPPASGAAPASPASKGSGAGVIIGIVVGASLLVVIVVGVVIAGILG
ncbi:serine/threonine-protein kinase [Streptomonospora litoralis]|uniref:Serine/threonine-protein kinase AfsK n=1 Tax=Streptomonospora litoralis TaxID=2498135 RepID=A0A4P6Q1V9_9ACTN|nr:serine/threonine-protein kinase [Streptomonospora litoralis]QBI52587.1 Serine/threonine-protein kinase AfsK [Streptomonospora litoralis]